MPIEISGTTGISGVDGSASTPAVQGSDSNTGVSFGTDIVNINTGGSTRATVDSAGRFLIGTTTEGEVSSDDLTIATAAHTGMTIRSGTSHDGTINFSDGTSGADEYRGWLQYNHTNNKMLIGTDATERMTIDGSGDIRVGRVYSNTTSGGANVRVQSDGLMQRDTSSRRYKNTIADATHGLADLNKLRPVTYKGNNDGDTVFGGLIAEEVHDAGLTEFVDYNSDNEPDALKYGNMVSLCIKAIQELSAKVETLETKVAALEAG